MTLPQNNTHLGNLRAKINEKVINIEDRLKFSLRPDPPSCNHTGHHTEFKPGWQTVD